MRRFEGEECNEQNNAESDVTSNEARNDARNDARNESSHRQSNAESNPDVPDSLVDLSGIRARPGQSAPAGRALAGAVDRRARAAALRLRCLPLPQDS